VCEERPRRESPCAAWQYVINNLIKFLSVQGCVRKAVQEPQLAGAAGKLPNLRSLSHVFKLVGWMRLWISYPTAIHLVASSHSISQGLINTLILYLFTYFWFTLALERDFSIYTFLRVWDTVR